MKFTLVSLAVSLLVSRVFGDDAKIEDAFGGCGCNRNRCPESNSLLAAQLLLTNLCTAGNTDLALIQSGGLLTNDSTLTMDVCGLVSTGPFLQVYLGSQAGLACFSLTVTSSYVTHKGQIVAFALWEAFDGDTNPATIRAVFNPDPVMPCKFLISELRVTVTNCP